MEFVHLHVHSHFTTEDGVAGVRELVRAARACGQHAVALTDLHCLAGIPALCQACREHGIRPIIGCELNLAPHDSQLGLESHFRIVLLVENESGYRHLVALVNRAHSNAKAGVPFLRPDDLQRYSSGLIALVGGPMSELYHLLKQGKLDEAESAVARLARIFGRENLVFTIQDHGIPRQRQINDRFYSLAEFLGVKCIATNSVCYLRPEDSICYDFLVQERPSTFLDFEAAKNPGISRHLATADEMLAKFRKYPKCIFTTAEVADRCTYTPNFERTRFPEHNFIRGFDADSYLWDLTFREAKERFLDLSPDIKARLNEEFDYIKRHGLSNNILLLWNVAQFCRKNRISTGVGSGNMVTSLAAYILGITRMNPLDYKLRFLGFGEVEGQELQLSIQIPPRHTRALQSFLRETFGAEFCSAIGRPVWQQRQQLAREIRAWYNSPGLRSESLSGEMSSSAQLNPDSSLESFFPGRVDGVSLPCPEVQHFMLSRLLPRPQDWGVEENEIAVSGESLNHVTPRILHDGELVTQYDVPALEMFHIPRLSVASNSVLNALDGAAAWVRQEENPAFDPDSIPMDDPDTFELLGQGLTSGIDPFHSITLKSLLRAHRPRNFMNLVKVKGMERHSGKEREPDVREHVPECLLTYRCAFIKAHYPISFMAAVLTNTYMQGELDRRKFTIILREAKRLGIRILPPDVNLSIFEFAQVQKGIRTGLVVVGGMNEKAYAELERVRRGGDFHDLVDLIRRTDARLIDNRTLSNLVKTGALDGFGMGRAQMLHLIAEFAEDARRGSSIPALHNEHRDQNYGSLPQIPAVPELPPDELVRHEIQAAGYSISQDQLHLYRDQIRQCRALAPGTLTSRTVGRQVYVAGFIDHVEADSPLLEDTDHLLLDLEGHVATIPAKAARQYHAAIQANAPVLLGGTVARRRDEIYLKTLTVFTLRMVQEMSEQVREVVLDLSGENSRTLRLLARLVRQYSGRGTEIRVLNYSGGFLDQWRLARIQRTSVFFSPPFFFELKKILTEDRIRIVPVEGFDEELLHALSPNRFPNIRAANEVSDVKISSTAVFDIQ